MDDKQISKDSNLSQLAASINALHATTTEQANRALESARNVGRLLNEAKQQVPHGQWITWLSNNCSVSPRQAQRYMKVADNWTAIAKNDATSYLTIDKAIAVVSEKKITKREFDLELVERLNALPSGKALCAFALNGMAQIFRSDREDWEGYWHFLLIHARGDQGEIQVNDRGVTAEGIGYYSIMHEMENVEWEVIDDSHAARGLLRHHWEPSMPSIKDFWRQVVGAGVAR